MTPHHATPPRSFAVTAFILMCAAGCASGRSHTPPPVAPPPPTRTAPTAIEWPKAYLDAIADALNPEPAEAVANLVAIVPDNPLLVWRAFPDGQRVLVVSLVGNTSFFPREPGAPYNTGAIDMWVTAVPEMRHRCSEPAFARGDLTMRLRQITGLTPSATVTAFVEAWALPSQLFRPAADNEVTDTTAGLNLPDHAEPWYRSWFNRLRAQQYFQSAQPHHDAYPWTQLGYTYDWGNADTHQGLSEFVVRQQSTLFINGITPYEAYCASRTF